LKQLSEKSYHWANVLKSEGFIVDNKNVRNFPVEISYESEVNEDNIFLKKYYLWNNWLHKKYSSHKWKCGGTVNAIVNNSDILIAATDLNLHFFDLINMVPLKGAQGTNRMRLDKEVLTMQFREGLLLTGSIEGYLTLYEIETGEQLFNIRTHSSLDIESLHWIDSQFCLSAGWDKSIRAWDISTETELFEIPNAHNRAITSVNIVYRVNLIL